jgi:hypothetical protein
MGGLGPIIEAATGHSGSFKRVLRVIAPIILLATTAGVVGIASPAGADSVSFSSGTIGMTGTKRRNLHLRSTLLRFDGVLASE